MDCVRLVVLVLALVLGALSTSALRPDLRPSEQDAVRGKPVAVESVRRQDHESNSGRQQPWAGPTVVHFVSSCHLDVGFANTAVGIVNMYFDKYFPAAIATAAELRKEGGEERLVFLTHTYLVSLYLDCPPDMGLHCPSQAAQDAFTAAVKQGDIVWHAMPFNSELSLLDASMAEFSLQLTHDLDAKMGKNKTITMSQRDVPGTTRGLIPILKKSGVQAITVGVNGATMPPAVPSIFRWQDPGSGEEVLAMWHPGGYGGSHCCSMSDAVVIEGADHALVFGVRGDNSGPPSATEVKKDWATLKKLFPNATIVASDYDAFVKAVLPYTDKLPVYTQEIGDTWIYGVPSDPWKVAASRIIMTLRSNCLDAGKCSLQDSAFYNFSRLLLKAGEHTWGLDVKRYLGDTTHWSNQDFHSVQMSSKFLNMAHGWQEQRDWAINYAVQALPETDALRADIDTALELITSSEVDLTGYTQIVNISQVFHAGSVEIGFSQQPAAINHLVFLNTQWAGNDSLLASLLYQSFTTADYEVFMAEYLREYKKGSWMDLDFGKPGLDKMKGELHQEIYASLKSLWMLKHDLATSFILEMTFPESLVSDYGAMSVAYLNVTCTEDAGIRLQLTIVNKTATRIPESLSLRFQPMVKNASSMRMEKLGSSISVLDVLNNGSKHLHAVSANGIGYESDPGLGFTSQHAALVCVGQPTPFPVPMATPDVSQGFSYNLANNIWGTNYIMWYPYLDSDKSFKFDFEISLPHV